MSNNRARASVERIREKVPIIQVLAALGYDVREDGGDREQQFRCDLHGTGHDNKPSARVYPDSNTWYCFACGITRDAIETLRTKQGIGFWQAVKILEQSNGLDPLPVDYGADERGETALHEMQEQLDQRVTFDDEVKRVKALLDGLTTDRELPLERLLSFWEAFDKAFYHVRGPHGDGGVWHEAKGRQVLAALRERILDILKDLQAELE